MYTNEPAQRRGPTSTRFARVWQGKGDQPIGTTARKVDDTV